MWTPLETLQVRIREAGGFINAHAHFDRALTVDREDFEQDRVNSHLHDKWEFVNKVKANSSTVDYQNRIDRACRYQATQGVMAALSFIDCDVVCEDRAIKGSLLAKAETPFKLLTACQTLQGVLEPEARRWFDWAAERVDIIGGLPGKDAGREAEHITVLLETAQLWKKRVHVHVDQLNSPSEKETELLARLVMKHGMEGKVTAVHGISIAAHPQWYRKEVYQMCLDAGLSFVACPTAWIDHRRTESLMPGHNAVTPIDEMVPLGIPVAIGTDNIADVYKPFCDGNMLTELRVLLESTHFYDVDELVKIATTNGRLVLGLQGPVKHTTE